MKNTEPISERYVATPGNRILKAETTVSASIDEIWRRWTTTEGVKEYFSSDARVEFYIGGPFEIYFIHDNPYGLKGSEDCRFLSYLPGKMISFEWNAPPDFGKLRDIKTIVVLNFNEIEPGFFKIELYQHGWGDSPEWDKLFDYFNDAWPWVLENFKKSFDSGN